MEVSELPRPQDFVTSKARLGPSGKTKEKMPALDIIIQKFWAGNLRLMKRLVHSKNPKHVETAKEFSEYLEYLGNKQKDS